MSDDWSIEKKARARAGRYFRLTDPRYDTLVTKYEAALRRGAGEGTLREIDGGARRERAGDVAAIAAKRTGWIAVALDYFKEPIRTIYGAGHTEQEAADAARDAGLTEIHLLGADAELVRWAINLGFPCQIPGVKVFDGQARVSDS